MADLNHLSDAPEDNKELPSARNTRYGLILFAVYLVLYCGYVLTNVFSPSLMEMGLLGVNLAVLSGFGLIIAALLLALLYAWLCRAPESTLDKEQRP